MRKCKYCGKPIPKNKKENIFCNVDCASQYRFDQKIDKWKNDVRGEIKRLPRNVRKYLIEKAGYKCEKCGWGEINKTTGVSPLEIHHIDGNSENNRPENLQVLCPNCHSLTPNYKALNSDGREWRVPTTKRYCIDCGAPIGPQSIRCKTCAAMAKIKVKPVTRDELKQLIRQNSFSSIGDLYGVTYTAIKKWCIFYGIPHRRKDIDAMDEQSWDLV